MKNYDATPRITYFGSWASEGSEFEGVRLAFKDMLEAVARCYDEEIRGPELQEAMDYLRLYMRRRRSLDVLNNALDLNDPAERLRQAREACKGIAAALEASGFTLTR